MNPADWRVSWTQTRVRDAESWECWGGVFALSFHRPQHYLLGCPPPLSPHPSCLSILHSHQATTTVVAVSLIREKRSVYTVSSTTYPGLHTNIHTRVCIQGLYAPRVYSPPHPPTCACQYRCGCCTAQAPILTHACAATHTHLNICICPTLLFIYACMYRHACLRPCAHTQFTHTQVHINTCHLSRLHMCITTSAG